MFPLKTSSLCRHDRITLNSHDQHVIRAIGRTRSNSRFDSFLSKTLHLLYGSLMVNQKQQTEVQHISRHSLKTVSADILKRVMALIHLSTFQNSSGIVKN